MQFSKQFSDLLNLGESLKKTMKKLKKDNVQITDTVYKKLIIVRYNDINVNDNIRKQRGLSLVDTVLISEAVKKTIKRNTFDNIKLGEKVEINKAIHVYFTDTQNVTDTIYKVVNQAKHDNINMDENMGKRANMSITLIDYIITKDKVIDVGLPIFHVIHLKGNQELYIYLKAAGKTIIPLLGDYDPIKYLIGSQEPIIYLDGEMIEDEIIELEGKVMTADKQNFSMIQGDSKIIIITMDEDITGAKVYWGAKPKVDSEGGLVISKSTETVGIILDGNTITVKLEPEDTKHINGVFYHECEIHDSLGNITTVTRGQMYIDKHAI